MNDSHGEVRKMEEWSSACEVERGRSGDKTAMTGVREAGCQWKSMSLPSKVDRVVCSSLELAQTLLPVS